MDIIVQPVTQNFLEFDQLGYLINFIYWEALVYYSDQPSEAEHSVFSRQAGTIPG